MTKNINWYKCFGWAILLTITLYIGLTAFVEWQWQHDMYSLDWLWKIQEFTGK